MKIGIVQCASVKGDVEKNVLTHVKYARAVAQIGGEIIVFPELSLTGYEPELAETLATEKNDTILQPLQGLATELSITICAGMPLKAANGISISMLIFSPDNLREVYSKQFLHDDEKPFFVESAYQSTSLNSRNISLAICYEISVSSHACDSAARNSRIYLSSVVKYPGAMKTAYEQLSQIASKHHMLVLMSNAVGLSEGARCGGLSAIWNEDGRLLAQLNDEQEGALVIDTETRIIETILFD